MIKETLTGLVLGTACLFGSAKADVIDVPSWTWCDFQSYINNAQSGDTLNLIYDSLGRGPNIQGNFAIDKDLNIEGNGYMIIDDSSDILTIQGNASVVINNTPIFSANSYAINVQDNSSLTYQNSELLQGTIYFNSTGNLDVNNILRMATEYSSYKTQIHLEKIVGNIKISENTFVESEVGIYSGESDSGSVLNILNNTMNNVSGAVIELSSLLNSKGSIGNNIFSNSGLDIKNPENLGNISFTNNNIFNTLDPPSENFYYDPQYVNPGVYDFRLQPESELWNKGLYIEGLTTWFPNENQTWIGAYGNPVPEPGTLELLVIGSLAGLSGLGYRALKKYKESL